MLNELEKDNPKVCCKGEEFTAFTIPQWADSIKNKKQRWVKFYLVLR